ncbi:MAG: hypothetical protein HFF00_02770 [Ruminiclostridium sp.]|jgi:predicted RNA-binding Zn-ribbon protein involved in translation (DUF1610 family)|nr:hypothetical protein [Ruminiclostridium sp.]
MAASHRSFWERHPGFDFYSLFWFLVLLVFAALGRLFSPLYIPGGIVLVYLLSRLLSKNAQKRNLENARFLALLRAIKAWFRSRKRALTPDKEYAYFKCPNCGQPMRVPRGLGTIEITCRSCSSRFETKS